MSHEGDGSERTQQRTVAELLAKYGNGSDGGAPRRRRRKPDDGSDTAPQAIIDRVMSDSGEMPVIREDQPPPERASHRQARGPRRPAPPPAPQAPPPAEPPRRAPQPEPAARRDPGEPMTEQLPRVPPAARRRRPEDAGQDGPPRKLPPERRPEPPAAPPRRVSAALEGTQRGIPALDATLDPAGDDSPAEQPPGPARRQAAALEGTQRAMPALDPDDVAEQPSNGRSPSLPRRAPGTSRMPQRAPKPMPPQAPPAPPKQPSQPLPAPQPSQQLPVPLQQAQPSQALPKPPFPAGPTAIGMTPVAAQTTEVGRPIRPGDFPGDAAQTEVDPQPPPPEFLEEHEAFDDKAARRFDGYTAHDALDSPEAEELDEFDDLDELEPEAEPEPEVSPAKAWLTMIAQLALGVVGGAAVWLGFNWLWGVLPVAALVAAVVVIAGLVFIVRKIRRADDLNTTVLAVLVGLVVTVSPAMLLLIGR